MNAEQLALDCEPDWPDDLRTDAADDRPPGPGTIRRDELRDLRRQGVPFARLYTADTVPTGSYL